MPDCHSDLKLMLLKEILLNQYSQYRWSVLVAALDSLQQPIGSIAEIGVHQGDCSKFLRKCFPDTKLYLIDPWEICTSYLESDGPVTKSRERMESAFQTVNSYFQNDPNTSIIREKSHEAVGRVPNNLDLVFIDGNHNYDRVKEDIALWLPKVRKGGILAGHDYDSKGIAFPGVKQAVDERFGGRLRLGNDGVWMYFT